MKTFKGVDWTIYVKMRNKERKSGEAKKEYDDENLLDEDIENELEEERKKKEEEEKAKADAAASGAAEGEKKEGEGEAS